MVALILARGGSKGVIRKNLKLLNGEPLLAYPIKAAMRSKRITKVYVSTEDPEIAEVAEGLGATIINRPKDLAKDDSLDIESFIHFSISSQHTEPIVHLRATTPILDEAIIDEAINVFETNINDYTSLRSAHKLSESVYKFYTMGDKYWEPIDKDLTDQPRQSCPDVYSPNGYVDIVKPEIFLSGKTFYGDKIYPYITDHTPEVDTLNDFMYIEHLMNVKCTDSDKHQ